jgi:hypothetical protein
MVRFWSGTRVRLSGGGRWAVGGVGAGLAVQCVPDDEQAMAEQSEGDGAFDGFGDAVAGLAYAEDVLDVEEGDFDAPAGGVAGDDLLGWCGEVGGDQREVIAAAPAGVAQENDADGVGAPGAVPQADAFADRHCGGGAVNDVPRRFSRSRRRPVGLGCRSGRP